MPVWRTFLGRAGPFCYRDSTKVRPDLKINHWAVIAAAIAAFVMSSVWYVAFGGELAKLSAAYADAQTPSAWKMLAEFARGLIITYVLAYFAMRLEIADWKAALRLAVWIWIFPAFILLGSILHEGYPWRLAAIHAGDWLVKLLVIALIVGVWRRT